MMLEKKHLINHIDLTSFGNMPPYIVHSDDLWEVHRKSRYRVNCQAGLWRRDTLHMLLKDHEMPGCSDLWHIKISKSSYYS